MKYEVSISPDKMSAMITLRDDGIRYRVTESEIMEALRRSGVRYGIIYENIKKLVEKPAFDIPMIIARGKPPVNGQDGRVEIKIKRKEGVETRRGRIDPKDFASRERLIVKEGDVVGKLIRPTKGLPGMNVMGERIEPKPGKPAKFRIGDGIRIEDDGTLVATKDGMLVVTKDEIRIEDFLLIKGDVDYSVGNIDFPGAVEIMGDVKAGFVVRAKKDIRVNGIVEAATVISYEGNVILNGVKGQEKGMIKAGKDVIAKFIENAHVEAGRDVEAEGPIANSIVKAKGQVKTQGKRGVVIGGLISVVRGMEVEELGSSLGVRTIVEVGVDPDLREEEKLLTAQIELDEQNLQKLLLILKDLKKMRDSMGGKLPEDKKEMYSKVTQTIIHLKSSLELNRKRLMEIRKAMEVSKKGVQIVVRKTLHAGVEITMFHRKINIDRPLYSVILVYDEKRGEVIVRAYRA